MQVQENSRILGEYEKSKPSPRTDVEQQQAKEMLTFLTSNPGVPNPEGPTSALLEVPVF